MYFIYRQKNEKSLLNVTSLFEMFVLIPIKYIDEEKTLVIFISNYDHVSLLSNKCYFPMFLRQKAKEERLNILVSLKDFLSSFNASKLKSEYFPKYNESLPTHTTQPTQVKKQFNNKDSLHNPLLEEPQINWNDFPNQNTGSDLVMETVLSNNLYDQNIMNINPNSILTRGEKLSLEERLPGYVKNAEGGVECRNYEELSTQDGIILEVMKRAGKQLLEGKNMVSVSLPVKIFEPRSMLKRITDNWGTTMLYLNKIAECGNPIQRMKYYIAFALSGLHMGLKQLKPFNPILGETYEVN